MLEESASICDADGCAPSTSGLAGQGTSQPTKEPIPGISRKRDAPLSVPVQLLKRVHALMAAPGYNAISVLHVLRPSLNFSFVSEQGPSHCPVFTCTVSIDEEIFEGKGGSKKTAKLNSAEKALKAILSESECADIVRIPANSISAMSQDSKDRSATPMVVKLEPVKKKPEPTGSSPVAIISDIRPGVQYFEIINSQDETLKASTGLKLYRIGVFIDGGRFEGSATSKKLAKMYAAEEGLKKLFGLECAHTSDGVPVFTGDSTCWAAFKKSKHEGKNAPLPQVLGLPEGTNPVSLINELYPSFKFTFGESEAAGSSERYFAHIEIEGTNFEGKGSNRKVARMNAAVEAITFLKNSGLLEQRILERRQRKAQKPLYKRGTRPAFQNSGGRPFALPKPTEEKLKDSVQKLKETFARVEYQIVSESTTKNDEGEAVMNFTVSATVDDKTFMGDGASKQQARLEAAEAALRGLGRWTQEDEAVKQEAKRLEMDKSRFARMLYGTNRMKGSGGGPRDWRSQGRSWVSGGVLGPNPLILPDSNDFGTGVNFEGGHDGGQYSSSGGFGGNMEGQQNDSDMGPPNGFKMEHQDICGMGPPNMGPQYEYGMDPVYGYGIAPSNEYEMGPEGQYGTQAPYGFGMEEQSGYGMGQSFSYGGCYTDFENGGNVGGKPGGSNHTLW